MFLPANEPNDLLGQLRCLQSARAKKQFRQDIYDAWGCECAYCGKPADTLDHMKPRCMGGPFVRTNLIAACKKCNNKRGTLDWAEWYRAQSFYAEDREYRIRRWIEG